MNKKIVVVTALLTLVGGLAFAQLDPFFPINPSTIGRGGSFTADAQGYNAFFYNPAGFAKKGELTLLSANVWAAMDARLIGLLQQFLTQPSGSAEAKGLMSRQTDPITENPLAGLFPPDFDFQAFSDSLTPFTDYLGAASSSADAAGSTAFQDALVAALETIQDDPALSAIFVDPTVDLTTLMADPNFDPTQLVEVINLGEVIASPTLLSGLLEEITTQVETKFTSEGIVIQQEDDQGNIVVVAAPTSADLDALNQQLEAGLASAASALPKGNLDLGLMVGAGWTGGGLGLGAFVNSFVVMRTPEMVGEREGTILDAQTRVFNTITLAGGIGIGLGDSIDVGVAFRPTMLSYGEVSPLGLLPLFLGSGSGSGESSPFAMLDALIPAGIYKSFYMGVDVGATMDLGALTVGVAAKDLLPVPMNYTNFTNTQEFIDAFPFRTGTVTVSAEEAKSLELYYVPPMRVNVGATWHPDLGVLAYLIDPKIGIDLFDLFGFLRIDENSSDPSLRTYNAINHIGVGANVHLLSLLHLRGGFYQGSLAGGVGLDLPFAEVNAAFLARDLEEDGTFSEAGLSLEVALRF